MAECAKSLMNFTKNYKVFRRTRTVGFETEGQNNVFEKFDGKQTSLLFSAVSKVPIKMRKFGQQMRNAVA